MSKLISQLPLALSVGPGDYLVLDQGSPPVTRLATVAQYTAASGMSTGAVGVVSDPKASRYFSQLPLASQVYLNDQMAVDQGTPPITRRATVSQVFYQSGTSGQNSELDVSNVSQRLSALPLASACSPQDFAIINQIDKTGNPITRRVPLSLLAHACSGGPTWTQFTLPMTLSGWGGMAYDSVHKCWITGGWLNGAYGTAMYVVSSADGKNWPGPMIELTSANGSGASMGVVACVSGVALVAAGDPGDAYYSIDGGQTWTHATSASLGIGNAPGAQGVASSTGRIFIPIGGSSGSALSYLAYFDVGTKTFGFVTMPATAFWWLTGGDGISKVMSVAPSGATAYSADGGLTWTAGATLPISSIARLVYGAGYWLVTSDLSSNEMAWSNNNGASWNVFTIPNAARYYTALYAQLVFLVISGLGGPSSSGSTYALTGMTPAALAEAVNAPPGQNNLNWLFLTDTDYAGHYSAVGFVPTNIGFYGVC